jgi:hypothetical protein
MKLATTLALAMAFWCSVSMGEAAAGVTGLTYAGNITFTPDGPGSGDSCITFGTNGRFTFQNPAGAFPGDFGEIDFLFLSIWAGQSDVGSAYSGFSLLFFLNVYSIETSAAVGRSASLLTSSACPTLEPPAAGGVDEAGQPIAPNDGMLQPFVDRSTPVDYLWRRHRYALRIRDLRAARTQQ